VAGDGAKVLLTSIQRHHLHGQEDQIKDRPNPENGKMVLNFPRYPMSTLARRCITA
jgi:hypothetical protein